MKSLKDYSLNIPENEYHDYPAWSYSAIARYARDGFNALATIHDKIEPTPSMEFGSLFDSIMTKGKKTLDEYAVMSVSVPDAERKALDYISSVTDKDLDSMTPDYVASLCDQCQYQMRWGADARYKHLIPFKEYYDIKRSGKKIVSEEDWNDAMEMYKAFRSSEYHSSIFGTKNHDGIEYIYQAQFVVDYDLGFREYVKLKIMPDLIIVDHNKGTVQPVDLKTSAVQSNKFAENFIKYRYDIQAELYTDVLRMVMDSDERYKDYKILPYLFSDISRTDKVPLTYQYDPKNGFSFKKGNETIHCRGWKSLLEEILDYEAEGAKVPSDLDAEGPNDLARILNGE